MTPTMNHSRLWRWCALPAFVLLGVSIAAASSQQQDRPRQPAAAQGQNVGEDLPSAEEILRKYVEATGGEEAYKKLTAQRSSGKFAIPLMGIEGTFELLQQHPDRFLATVTLPGMGEMKTGLTGDIGWRNDPMQGPRLVEGEELKSLKREADIQSAIRPKEHFSQMEVKGVEEVNGEKAYRLVLTPKDDGKPMDVWYSVESGLMLKSAGMQESEMGEVRFESEMADYQEMDGEVKVKQPRKITTRGGGAEYVITLEKVEANPEIPAERFELPPEVKQLTEQKQQ